MSSNDLQKTDHPDVPLVIEMESLGLSEASIIENGGSSSSPITDSDESPQRRTGLRKRISSPTKTENRRVTTKPIKRLNDIKQIYLCKKIKKLAPNLETIYEEPKTSKNNELQFTGLRKERRFIVFDQNKKGKIKKRQVKIKSAFNKKKLKKKHVTMELLLKKLHNIE